MSVDDSVLQRAYSLLTVKSVDDDQRIIEGIASTPEPDRVGDIVEPLGAQFSLPLPMLWQHGKDPFIGMTPVGHVIAARSTADGIPVQIQMERSDEPGRLKEILDFAWQALKKRLVTGFSIGFRPLGGTVPIKGTFGVRIPKWEWLELSAVTIPTNADATILTVKSVDAQSLAASGTGLSSTHVRTPGATGSVVRLAMKDAPTTMKTLTEQIQGFEATRQAKAAEQKALMDAAGEKGETLDTAAAEQYDTLKDELKSIDEHLVRLRDMEDTNRLAAKAVDGSDGRSASQSRQPSVIYIKDNLPPGIEFTRYAMCVMRSKGNLYQAMEMAKINYPDNPRIHTVLKAAVASGTTTDSTWANPLTEYQTFAGDFVEYLRPATIIGKFGTDGIPSLRRIPFQVRILGQTSGGDGYWVGQALPKPLTKYDFTATNHPFAKVAAITVLSQELVRFSSPSAEGLVRDALRDSLVARLDTDFIDPDKSIVANVSPASITNNVAPIATAGSSAADVRVDVMAVMAPLIAANVNVASGVWIMTPTRALALSLLNNSLGQPEFPGITMNGGRFMGFPVIVSQYASAGSPTSDLVIFAVASEIYLSDDGQVTIDASGEASLEMLDSALTQSGAAGTGASLVSLWQNNLLGLRAERMINWSKRRTTAVQFIEDVTWGNTGGSPA